ncbi:threonine--tRNA ligase [Helicobacter winghamensis]|uniref:Threonine--tRNA ligase n=1 Tax=Helicobacter winghamensis TaxID=157268 RepID=A0A2N3PIR9_9HELI|nr:threonine--tRNA ligase [Helicobacter winghamensis]EEO25270.1 threonine--tRNA ligase [Helicobacter winghamensis ATCC BAA-430]PKT76312.1 threonine--tRNA ligase [Helicobacter winghamensis]PKT76443.1 threonine--tRNA ligase [Helicobacter winghamensis]PKT76574.1 threonine--tRNA ligase [Helicobacter winghamensis]PKT80823.1 threonine--tRNA ligase [Helicobacter winghamensis]
MSQIIGIKANSAIYDTQSAEELGISGEPIYFDNSEDALSIMRHTCAHLMAEALKALYPEAQFFVGPVVEEGFYYDFRVNHKISEEDLSKIEAKMKEIAKKGEKITKYYLTREEAIQKFQNDDLKQAVISRIPLGDGRLSIYAQGEFEDLCRGPHLPTLKLLNAFKLTKVAGAYLGGDEKAEMLTRIYGIAFADKESLTQYLHQLEEAKKRDHRKVGVEMELFTFDEEVGAGLPIWLPKGARLRRNLENLLTQALIERGYEPVRGPEILKSAVWKTSGHYANYGENMYFTTIDEVEYGIKPMNCVGHIKVYQNSLHSYRELPLRFYEYGVVHRHEKSGVLHGLLRVREFTQDDAHIFCRPSQIASEVESIIDFTQKIMNAFGFSYEMEISTKPEKSIGSEEVWEEATQALKGALERCGIAYKIDEGGGAFYGPKIDIKITDAIGRKWQCGTVQIDMNLPERFALTYTDENNSTQQPVMIHRAILGSFERFVAILTEHFGGEFPFFVAPTQVIIIPISEAQYNYAKELHNALLKVGVYAEIENKNETLNKRIRNAEKQRVPMIAVLGAKEKEERLVAVRDRRLKEQSNMSFESFITLTKEKMREVSF